MSNAEKAANFAENLEKKFVEIIIHYNGFQMEYNRLFSEKIMGYNRLRGPKV